MTSFIPISDSEEVDLRSLVHLAYRDVGEREIGEKIIILLGLIGYAAIVWLTSSVLVAIVGGVIMVSFRTLSVEIFLKRRLTFLTDLLVEMDKRDCERLRSIHSAIGDQRS